MTVYWRPGCPYCARLRRMTPGFAPDRQLARTGRRLRLLRVVQWTLIGGLIVASFAVESAGHSGLSWALDGVALAFYLAFRLATAAAR